MLSRFPLRLYAVLGGPNETPHSLSPVGGRGVAAGQERKLIWSDEFNTPGAPDPAKWGYESGLVRNEESQFYTEGRRENARVENGMLVLEARKERWPNPQHQSGANDWRKSRRETAYTSASVTTQGKAEWTYGRVEVRAKLPTGRGLWPAIWLLGASCPTVGWPLCGEIDIMENVGYEPDVIHANIHTQAYNHVQKTNKGGKITVAALGATFMCTQWTGHPNAWSSPSMEKSTSTF